MKKLMTLLIFTLCSAGPALANEVIVGSDRDAQAFRQFAMNGYRSGDFWESQRLNLDLTNYHKYRHYKKALASRSFFLGMGVPVLSTGLFLAGWGAYDTFVEGWYSIGLIGMVPGILLTGVGTAFTVIGSAKSLRLKRLVPRIVDREGREIILTPSFGKESFKLNMKMEF